MDESQEVEIKVVLLTGMITSFDVHLHETVLDVKQVVAESIESCYITSFDLLREDGSVLHEHDTFAGTVQGDTFTMRFRRYDDKDLRYHVAHTQELVVVPLDEMMVSVTLSRPHFTPSASQQRSYPSFHKLMGPELKSLMDSTDGTYRGSYQAALHSVEYSIDPNCNHSVGFTFQQEKKLIEQTYARKGSTELPDAGNFSCAEDFDKDVTLEAFYDMMNQTPSVKYAVTPQVSLLWSGANPPPRHRRLQGDLAYLDVQFTNTPLYQVTATPTGFFVNASKTKHEFNPQPHSTKACHSETLMGLLFQLNPKFSQKTCELLRIRASLHPYETGPMLTPTFPHWMEPPESRTMPNGTSILRSAEGSPAVTDVHSPIRTWNDEIQLALEMPSELYEDKLAKERRLSRLHTEFVEFSTRTAIMVVDSQISPINPQEPPETWVYVVNNVFISQALQDTRGALASMGGDNAARVLAKQDLHGIAAIRRAQTSLATVNTVIVDYKGRRMLCQTLVPGFLVIRVDGRSGSPQVLGISEDDSGAFIRDEEVEKKCSELGRQLHLKAHTMKDKFGTEVQIGLSTDVKAMLSTDGRHYLLECSKLFPRDVNFPENPLAFIRIELRDEFLKKKRVGPAYDKLRADIKQKVQEKSLAEKDSNRHPASPPKIISELGETFLEAEMLRQYEIENPPVLFNTDVQSYTSEMGHVAGEEEMKEDEAILVEVADFLRSKVIILRDELLKMDIIDTESLSDIFHEHGVNMRYLGIVADLLPENAAPIRKLLITDMIARVVRHRLRETMVRHTLEDISTPIASELSALLSAKGASPPTNTSSSSCSSKKKKKKKGKKVEEKEPPQPSEPATSATPNCTGYDWLEGNPLPSMKSALAKEIEEKMEKITPHDASLPNAWVRVAVLDKFKFDLKPDFMESSVVSRFVLLRAICSKVGLCIKQRVYLFEEHNCIEADDILDISPILHYHAPRYEVVEGLLDHCHHEDPEVMARRIHNALNHANQIAGAVCYETTLCFQAVAKVMLSLNDLDTAIQDHCKALITARRLSGPTHGNMVPLLKMMGMLAHLSGRPQAAYLYLLRAVYLSRVLCGDVALEVLLTLVSFLHETENCDKALHVLQYAMEKAKAGGEATVLSLAACHQHLAMIIGPQGDLDKAVDNQKRALDLYSSALGDGDSQVRDAESWYRYWVRYAVERRKNEKSGAIEGAGSRPTGLPGGATKPLAPQQRIPFKKR